MATHTSPIPAAAPVQRERRPALQTLVGGRSGCGQATAPLSASEELALLHAIGGGAAAGATGGGAVRAGGAGVGATGGGAVRAGGVFLSNDDGLFLLPAGRSAAPPDALGGRLVRLPGQRLLRPAAVSSPGRAGIALDAPGTTLAIPVADVARQLLATIRQHVRDGRAIVDDRSRLPIAGIEHYADLIDLDAPLTLSHVEAQALAQASAELSADVRAALRAVDRLGLAAAPVEVDGVALLGAHARDAFPPPQLADLESATRAIEAAAPPAARPTRAERRALNAAGLIAQHVRAVHGRFPATVPALSAHTLLQVRRVEPAAGRRAVGAAAGGLA
jgi:hypothetical protein